MKNNVFYDYGPIDSYKRGLNIIVGERGVGKTYGAKRKVLKKYIENGEQAVWIRRKDAEIKLTKDRFMGDIESDPIIEGHEFITDGYILYEKIKDESGHAIKKPVIFFVPLSTYEHYKSASYHRVTTMVFDEFMTRERYLPDEVFKFFDIMETVFRHRQGKVYMLGNSLSIINPYFEHFNIKLNGNQFIKSDNWVVENCNNTEFRAFKKETFVGQMTKDSVYAQYAQDNEFVLDDTTNVMEYTGHRNFMHNLMLNGLHIGVYNCNNMLYFAEPLEGRTYTIYVDDCVKNGAFILDRRAVHITRIYRHFIRGMAMYKTMAIKNEIVLLARKCGRNF